MKESNIKTSILTSDHDVTAMDMVGRERRDEDDRDQILMKELAEAQYHVPLQIGKKSVPMEKLNAIITHQILVYVLRYQIDKDYQWFLFYQLHPSSIVS